ncbi:MAG: hypothetical protein JW969_15735 [Spirochaetales bacterium]|nr:hypothetical protein [Spirochaetales bacterium]
MGLLYRVYAGEMGWVPDPENPSKWIICEDAGGKYFKDIFSPVSRWFGVFDGSLLIGTGRVIDPVNGKLDMELYHNLPEILGKSVRLEFNRVAILREYGDTNAFPLLCAELLFYLSESKAHYCLIASPTDPLTEFSLSMGFRKPELGGRFKYHASDIQPVQVLYIDCRDKKGLLASRQKLLLMDAFPFRLM